MIKLSKFPVVSPTGAQYLVTVYDYDWYHVAHVYIERPKLFGLFRFKRVDTSHWHAQKTQDDYAVSAISAVLEYEEKHEKELKLKKRKTFFDFRRAGRYKAEGEEP